MGTNSVGSVGSGFSGLNLGSGGSTGPSSIIGGGGAVGGMANISNQATYGSSQGGSFKAQSSFGSTGSGLSSNISSASFLQSEINMNDPAVLRKRIADLESENRRLKESDLSTAPSIA